MTQQARPLIHLICALPAERDCLLSAGLVEQPWVRVSCSGVGAVRATRHCRQLLKQHPKPPVLISCGFAGALCPELSSGTLLLPREIYTTPEQPLSLSGQWQGKLMRQLMRYAHSQQPMLQLNAPATTPAHKQRLFQQYQRQQVASVDMETAAIASVGHQAGIEVAALRVVIDPAHRRLPDAITPRGQLKWRRLMRAPQQIPELMALAYDYHRARRALRLAARAVAFVASRPPAKAVVRPGVDPFAK